tara:strand:+ start:152 stop:310 length:159 start_codon:yes stop_codon:yes gene_type:complete
MASDIAMELETLESIFMEDYILVEPEKHVQLVLVPFPGEEDINKGERSPLQI